MGHVSINDDLNAASERCHIGIVVHLTITGGPAESFGRFGHLMLKIMAKCSHLSCSMSDRKCLTEEQLLYY